MSAAAVLDRDVERTRDLLPRVLPFGWGSLGLVPGGFGFGSRDGLRVIASGATYGDGRWWLHVSVSRRDRLPSWEDVRRVKDVFIGRDALALQVLPPEAEYINHNPHVLHLWHCPDERTTPDFRRAGSI